jgi:hypothetical protein
MESQNIWAMNFANALLVYGFVYFYFRSVKPGIKIINSTMQGIYYGISVIGFYSFLNFGMLQQWSLNVLIHELIFAVIGGVFCGLLVYYLYKRFYPFDLSKRSDG